MTTREFIRKEFNNDNGINKTCSSVVKDGYGNIYSYGQHYPLLFTINGLTFINTSGYSNTTAKHISWAWSAVDYKAIGVKLQDNDFNPYYLDKTLDTIITRLTEQRDKIIQQMLAKTRKDTTVYMVLQLDLKRVNNYLAQVNHQQFNEAIPLKDIKLVGEV